MSLKKLLVLIIVILFLISPLLSATLAVISIWKYSGWTKNIKFAVILSLVIILFLPFATVFGMFPLHPVKVSGSSMEPAFGKDEYLMARTYYPMLDSLKRGDVVIHKFPTDRSVSTIRRIIGLPGDQIQITDGKVVINNKLLNEGYLLERTTKAGKFLQEKKRTKIPKDSYVVMGDNRAESKDSREWGYLNAKDIENKYLFCYWNCR